MKPFSPFDAERLKQRAFSLTVPEDFQTREGEMLSEKYILVLEAIRRQQTEARVVSTSPHVPVTLPVKKG